MKKEIHTNGKGWKAIATSTHVQLFTPSSWWEQLIPVVMMAPVAFLGVRSLHMTYPASAFIGLCLFMWWVGRNMPTYSLTCRQLIRPGAFRRPVAVADLLLVSDVDHSEVILANNKTGRAIVVWQADSGEDKAVVVQMLRRGIKQEGKFAEQGAPGYRR